MNLYEFKNLNIVTDEEQKKVVQTQNINFMTAQCNQPENLKFKNKLGFLLLYLLWYCEYGHFVCVDISGKGLGLVTNPQRAVDVTGKSSHEK